MLLDGYHLGKKGLVNTGFSQVNENLVVLKNNPVYRISDLFYMRGIRWEKDRAEILTNDQYEDSILREYLVRKQEELDFSTLKSVVDGYIEKNRIHRAADNELTMHVRLGDVMEVPSRYKECLTTYKDIFKKIPFDISRVEKVNIVTALHFGANELNNKFFYSKRAHKRSLNVLRGLYRDAARYDLKVELVSNSDPDKDFAYLAASRNFIRGRSGFSDLVASCLSSEANDIVI